mgnify:CR=1 FL=1
MTTATKVTFLRLILIPVMVVFLIVDSNKMMPFLNLEVNNFIAAVIFVIAASTDFIDGYIARKYNQITNLGKFLDPIADKILVISAMTYLIAVNRIYFWTVIIVIFREFVVTGIRLLAVEKGEVIAASPYGKAKTITTMIAIVLMLFNNLFIPELIVDIVWYLAVLLTLISGLDYLFKNINIFKEK